MISKYVPHNHRSVFVALALFFSLPTIVTAQSKSKSSSSQVQTEQSPEMKKNMADMYQRMADCMRTDKSMQDCQKDVMKDCPVMKATGSCPLMNGMKDMNMDSSKPKKK